MFRERRHNIVAGDITDVPATICTANVNIYIVVDEIYAQGQNMPQQTTFSILNNRLVIPKSSTAASVMRCHSEVLAFKSATTILNGSFSWKLDQRGYCFPDEIKIKLKHETFKLPLYFCCNVFGEIREMPQWANASLFLVLWVFFGKNHDIFMAAICDMVTGRLADRRYFLGIVHDWIKTGFMRKKASSYIQMLLSVACY